VAVFGPRVLAFVPAIDFETPMGGIGKEAVAVGMAVVQSSEPPPPGFHLPADLTGTFAPNSHAVEVVDVQLARRLASGADPSNRTIGEREMQLVDAEEAPAGVGVVAVTSVSEMAWMVALLSGAYGGAALYWAPAHGGVEEQLMVMLSEHGVKVKEGEDWMKVLHREVQLGGLDGVRGLLEGSKALMPGAVPLGALARVFADHIKQVFDFDSSRLIAKQSFMHFMCTDTMAQVRSAGGEAAGEI